MANLLLSALKTTVPTAQAQAATGAAQYVYGDTKKKQNGRQDINTIVKNSNSGSAGGTGYKASDKAVAVDFANPGTPSYSDINKANQAAQAQSVVNNTANRVVLTGEDVVTGSGTIPTVNAGIDNSAIEQLQSAYEAQLAQRNQYAQQLSSQQAQYESALTAQQNQAQAELAAQLKAQQEQYEAALRAQQEAEALAARNAYDNNMAALVEAYQKRVAGLGSSYDSTKSQLEASYNGAIQNLADYYDSSKQSLADQYATQLSGLESDYDEATGVYNDTADRALQEAYINRMLQEKSLQNQLSSMGLSGGASESVMASLVNSYGNSRNAIESDRAINLANLARDYNDSRASVGSGYNQALTELLNAYNTNRQNASDAYNQNLASALTAYNNAMAKADENNMAYRMQLENDLRNNTVSSYQNLYNGLANMDSNYTNAMLNLINNQSNANANLQATLQNTMLKNQLEQQAAASASGLNAEEMVKRLVSLGLTDEEILQVLG